MTDDRFDPFSVDKFVTADNLTAPNPSGGCVFHGLYRGCLTFLVAQSGTGKSSYLLHLATCMASGGAFCDYPVPHPLRVLYLNPENSPSLTFKRLERIGMGRHENLTFCFAEGVDLSRPDHMKALKSQITGGRFDIVILDPIANLFATEDENDNAEAAKQMSSLLQLARSTNACIIAVHHSGKGKGTDSQDGWGRGASARLSSADVGILMRTVGDDDYDDTWDPHIPPPDRNDLVRLQQVKNRQEPKSSLFLQMAGNDRFERSCRSEWMRATHKPTGEPTKSDRAKHPILNAIGPDWMDIKTILNTLSDCKLGSDRTIRRSLEGLVKQEVVECRTAGKNHAKEYRVPSTGEEGGRAEPGGK